MTGVGSIWNTVVTSHCRKHKFQCGIVFHGGRDNFTQQENICDTLGSSRNGSPFMADFGGGGGSFSHGEETFVTPLVAATRRPWWPLHNRFDRNHKIYIPHWYSTSPQAGSHRNFTKILSTGTGNTRMIGLQNSKEGTTIC